MPSVLNSAAACLRMMEYLADAGQAGISEMNRDLGITTGTAYRLARTLVGAGFAEQNPENRKYRLSGKVVTLAGKLRRDVDLRELAEPLLAALADESRETVNLGTLSGGEIVYLEKISSPELMTIEVRAGSHVVAHCTGMGKAILAYVSPEELDRYLRATTFPRLTKQTITTAPRLRKELEAIRQRGYAIDQSELLEDVRCVAAPILNGRRRPVAAISISTPKSRFDEQRDRLAQLVTRTASELSALAADLEAP